MEETAPPLDINEANRYARLWYDSSISQASYYISRRVLTTYVIDRAIVKDSVTFDINTCQVAEDLGHRSMSGTSTKSFSLPLLLMPNEPFFDIDVKGNDGQSLHVCRRYSNQRVGSLILIGMFLMDSSITSEDIETAYRQIWQYLDASTEVPSLERDRQRDELVDLVAKRDLDVDTVQVLNHLLTALRHSFFLCIDYSPSTATAFDIIKVSFSRVVGYGGQNNRFYRAQDDAANSGDMAITDDQDDKSRGCAANATACWRAYFGIVWTWVLGMCNFAKAGLWRTAQRIGIVSSRYRIPCPLLGWNRGNCPTHVRLVVPEGTILDHFRVFDNDTGVSPRSVGVLNRGRVKFHHERGIVFDRGLVHANYELIAYLNPKRSLFLIPALIASLLIAALLYIALSVGPFIGDSDLSAGFVSAMFLIPSASALFIANTSEHEVVSQMLGWGRLMLAITSVLTVVSGCMIVIRSSTEVGRLAAEYSYWLALSAFIGASMCSFLFTFQIMRIGLNRYAAKWMLPGALMRVELDRAPELWRSILYWVMKVALFCILIGVPAIFVSYVYTGLLPLHNGWIDSCSQSVGILRGVNLV